MAGPQPSWRTNLGIAKEVTVGTAVAPTAFIPVDAITPKRVINQLADKSVRGSSVDQYAMQQGTWHSELDIPGDVYPDTIGWLLAAILGDVNTTGVGAPFTHRFAVKNDATMQPKSYTLTDFYVASARAYAAAMCVELGFKWNADGKLSYSSKWVSKAEASASTPTASFSTVDFLPGWLGLPVIRALSPTMLDAEFTLKRAYDLVPLNNSQDPQQIMLGPLTVEGKCTLMMEDDTYYNQFTTNDQGKVALVFARGAGAGLQSLTLQCNKAAWREGNIDRGGAFVKLPLIFVGLGNATDAGVSGGLSNISVALQNAIAGGVYV